MMDITPLQAFYGSMMIVMLATLLTIVFRQGQSPTRKEMHEMHQQLRKEVHEMHQQLREELRAEIREAVSAVVGEVTADTHRQMSEVHRRLDGIQRDVNRALNGLANHEHIDGRVMIIVQPDAEPAPAAAD